MATTFNFISTEYLSLLSKRIINTNLFTLVIICLLGVSPTYSLEKDSENVCSKLTSVKVVDVYPFNWIDIWDCQSHYPETTCDLIRSGVIDIELVYFIREELYCCPGWMLSNDDDDDDDEDDEKECDQPCPSGYFGENCQYQCRCFNSPTPDSCDATDGACDCSPGWTGRECDQSCSPRRYGPNCSLRSDIVCKNGGRLDPKDGFICLCPSSFTGPDCGIEGPDPVLCESCLSGICDTSIKACRCDDGLMGRYCTDLCDVGKGGQFCNSDCCSGNGRCYRDKCFCQDGFIGAECDTKCDVGKYGRNCQLNCPCQSCDHVTGVCRTCPPGFKGDTCTERCSSSQWGQSCNNTCTCESGQVCDVFTGECPESDVSPVAVTLAVVAIVAVVILLITCIAVCCLSKRRQRKVQNKNNQLDAVANESYSTLTARNEASQYAGLTLDYRYGSSVELTENGAYHPVRNGTPSKTRTEVFNPSYGVHPKEVIQSKDDGHHYNTIEERKEQTEDDGLYLTPKKHIPSSPADNQDYAMIKK